MIRRFATMLGLLASLAASPADAAPLRVQFVQEYWHAADPYRMSAVIVDGPRGREVHSLGTLVGDFQPLFVNDRWQVVFSIGAQSDPLRAYVLNYGAGSGYYTFPPDPYRSSALQQLASARWVYGDQPPIPEGYDVLHSEPYAPDSTSGAYVTSLDEGSAFGFYKFFCECAVLGVDEEGTPRVEYYDLLSYTVPASWSLVGNQYYSPVPEPSTYALLGLGLAGLWGVRHRGGLQQGIIASWCGRRRRLQTREHGS